MLRRARVGPYPWAALDRVDRRAERGLSAARRWLERAGTPARFAATLSAIIGAEVRIAVVGVRAVEPEPSLVRVGFALGLGDERCVVAVEPALATALLSTLLRRKVPLVDPAAPLDASIRGALAALVVEAARGSGAEAALRPTPAAVEGAVSVELAVELDGRPYAAALSAAPRGDGTPARVELGALAGVELALPLVVGVSLAASGQIAKLVRGAAWCPGAGSWIDRDGVGRGVLCARSSERGLGVELGSGGKIVLRDPAIVPLSATEAMAMNSEQSDEQTLADAVLDAPLVVRVELGQVSMTARDWAALKPGDVLETRRRVGEPVSLSAGGRVLARGELVDVEGELGVRVTQLLSEERS